ncbi:MAG: T9SS type A sorting domain-containing protein [Lewinellaceae bacterium]|nr:T9SS type A sorting domain-containing protein [Lewinellaceae bacterium]
MKQFFQLALLCLGLCAMTTASAQTVIYVKNAGTGAGTSWADAYGSLDAALAAANSGDQIWVAAGIYRPSNPAPNHTFMVMSGVELYGGFAGTEAALSERDYAANTTILSGDVSGNDITGDFTSNRTDNSLHVLLVQNGDPNDRAIIDGFRVQGGNTSNTTSDPDLNLRGGGILTTAQLTVRNCTFVDNFGRNGGCISAPQASCSGIMIDHCVFEGNYGTSQSAGVHLRQLTSGTVKNCIFRNNLTNRGCVYPETSSNITVDSCLFEKNETGASQFGAAMFTWQTNFTLKNSIIRNNMAYNGAGMYNDGRDGVSAFLIENCVFDSNSVTSYGGTCLYNWIDNFEIRDCIFKDNYAPTTGSAMYNRSCVGIIKDCLFENGFAGEIGVTGFGGAVANYSAGSDVVLEGCTFLNNIAGTSGGAVTVGFTAKTTLKDCLFEGNTARFGGAVFNQNDSTTLIVDGCTFNENGAEIVGGALNLSSGIFASVKNSVFFSNSSDVGGAIDISEDSLDLASLDVENCVFRDNFCLTQSGAININNAEVNISNCLFAANLNLGTGAGGAVTNNAAEGTTPPANPNSNVNITNCTFGANFGTLGILAQYENAGEATMTLQNCIIQSDGIDNYAVEAGAPEVISMGGNLSNDVSFLGLLTGLNDKEGEDPLFLDIASYDFHIPTNSPAIDIGNPNGAPATDLEGNPRINEPDAGAYENQDVVGVFETPSARPMQLMPNPAVDFVQISLEDEWNGQVRIDVTTITGAVVRSYNTEKNGAEWTYQLNVRELPAGTYVAKARIGETLYLGKIVKQ